mgnify:CR=1 FL=1
MPEKFINKIKRQLGLAALLIILGIYLLHILNVRFWNRGDGTIEWDIISYYAYLPAAFIYDDLSLSFIEDDKEFFSDYIWPEKTEEGNKVIKTSMGLAYLYSPFFLIAHQYSKKSDYQANGYSLPYHLALSFSSLFYAIFGFWFLWKILRTYFSHWVSFITMISIGLGTNLFAYTTVFAPMPHSFNFTLIILFIWLTMKWYEKRKLVNSFFLGLVFGLIVLIRPTNIVILLFFLLYGINNKRSFKERFHLYLKNSKFILVIVVSALIIWTPQLLYWKNQTGDFLYFSYGEDEKFFWLQPVFWKGLFGFRKGWLIYTPIMIFGVAGIFLLKGKLKDLRLPIILTLVTAMYLIFSWWCWWYGGSFGMRPMIDYYGMLAIPMASFLQFASTRKRIARNIFYSLFSIGFLLGIYHYIQFHYDAIHYDSMTWKAYKHSFGRIHDSDKLDELLEPPDYEEAKRTRN